MSWGTVALFSIFIARSMSTAAHENNRGAFRLGLVWFWTVWGVAYFLPKWLYLVTWGVVAAVVAYMAIWWLGYRAWQAVTGRHQAEGQVKDETKYTVGGRGHGPYKWEVEYEEIAPMSDGSRWAGKAVNIRRDDLPLPDAGIGLVYGTDDAEAVEKLNALMIAWAQSHS